MFICHQTASYKIQWISYLSCSSETNSDSSRATDSSLKTNLKLVSAIFFIFSPNVSHSKIMKNAFHFIWKDLFCSQNIQIFAILPSFPHFPDSKGQMKVEWFILWIGLHKLAGVIIGITQKSLYVTSSDLVR